MQALQSDHLAEPRSVTDVREFEQNIIVVVIIIDVIVDDVVVTAGRFVFNLSVVVVVSLGVVVGFIVVATAGVGACIF